MGLAKELITTQIDIYRVSQRIDHYILVLIEFFFNLRFLTTRKTDNGFNVFLSDLYKIVFLINLFFSGWLWTGVTVNQTVRNTEKL